jgi:hypothetical protein
MWYNSLIYLQDKIRHVKLRVSSKTCIFIIIIIISARLAVHIARMGVMRDLYKLRLENPKGRYHTEDLRVDGRIILEWILGK